LRGFLDPLLGYPEELESAKPFFLVLLALIHFKEKKDKDGFMLYYTKFLRSYSYFRVASIMRPCLVRVKKKFRYCSIFIIISISINYGLIGLKKFIL
jgi:hypothetical protein